MTVDNEQTGLVILGSIFLGVWIFGLLWGFGFESTGNWALWGFIGFLIAGAGYGVRATGGAVRIALLAGLGVLSTVLFLSALDMEDPSVFGALCTALGGGLIMAALPRPGTQIAPAPQTAQPPAQPTQPGPEWRQE